MALDLLRSAKSILKIDDLTIDNIVFKLHYRVTVAILIGSSLVGVAKQVILDILCPMSHQYFIILVFRWSHQLSDQLWSIQRSAGWLLLDTFNLSYQIWVPSETERGPDNDWAFTAVHPRAVLAAWWTLSWSLRGRAGTGSRGTSSTTTTSSPPPIRTPHFTSGSLSSSSSRYGSNSIYHKVSDNFHFPGCFILRTKENMENLRGRTYGFIW